MSEILNGILTSDEVNALRSRHPHSFKEIIEDKYRGIQFDPALVFGKTVIDVGAHVGIFSLLCQACGAASITCVEASPENFRELTENTKRCGAVRLSLNKAVADGCSASLRLYGNGPWAHTMPRGASGNETYVDIPCISLEELLLLHDGDDVVMKMDIEGAEYDVLPSCQKSTLRKCKTIFLETHNIPEFDGLPGKTSLFLKDYLKSMGFEVVLDQWMFDGVPNFEMIKINRR